MYFNYRCWGLTLLFSLLVTSCATTTGDKDAVQVKFVGVWTGEHQIIDENILRKWKQIRNSDGTYELRFNVFKDGLPVDTMLDMRHTDKFYYKPIDKRTNYVKRCVGIPGDTLSIKHGYVYINGKLGLRA